MSKSSLGFIASAAPAVFVACFLGTVASGQVKPKASRPRVVPEPYTAEFRTTRVQTLANGTTITRETTSTEARDSQGRFVFASTSTPNAEAAPVTHTHMDDEVTGTRTDFDSQTKKAVVVKLPPADQRHGCWFSEIGHLTMQYSGNEAAAAGSIARTMPKPVREDLGNAVIQGVEAHGERTTFVTPVGTAGNDQPLTRTIENWSVPSLGLQVRRLIDDPRNGKQDKELVNITRGEPDTALFQIPEGYQVVTDDMVPCKE